MIDTVIKAGFLGEKVVKSSPGVWLVELGEGGKRSVNEGTDDWKCGRRPRCRAVIARGRGVQLVIGQYDYPQSDLSR